MKRKIHPYDIRIICGLVLGIIGVFLIVCGLLIEPATVPDYVANNLEGLVKISVLIRCKVSGSSLPSSRRHFANKVSLMCPEP